VSQKTKRAMGFLLYFSGLWRLARGKKFTILSYHRICEKHYGDPFLCVTPQNFERQIQYLKRRYAIISLTELIKLMSQPELTDEQFLAITFDDGYRDNYTYAYPILKKYRVPATIFLTTGYIDTDKLFWWDRLARVVKAINGKNGKLRFKEDIYPIEMKKSLDLMLSSDEPNHKEAMPRLCLMFKEMEEKKRERILDDLEKQMGEALTDGRERPYPLSWKEIKEMNEGGISFGSHTVNHTILSRVELTRAREEIVQSKLEIEKRIGKKVEHFSYPNGRKEDFNREMKELLKDNNYLSACSAINGATGRHDDLFSLKRRDVTNSPVYIFALKVSGIFDWFWLKTEKGKINQYETLFS